MESLKLFCSSQPSDHVTLRAWESRDRVDVTVAEDGSYRGIAASRNDARKMRDWLTEWLGDAPVVNWQPIEPENIKPGMEVRRERRFRDALGAITFIVARLSDSAVYSADGVAAFTTDLTDHRWNWFVNPATIPDPDAELIEAVAETLYRTDWPSDMWDGLSVEAYRELAQVALAAIRAEEAGEQA